MTDYVWPTTLIPATSEITLHDFSARFRSPFTGSTRTVSRPGGDLVRLALTLPPVKDAQKAALVALVAKLRGGVNRVWCKDHSYVKRGTFPTAELLPGPSGWTATNGELVLSDDNGLRMRRTAVAADRRADAAAVTTTNGATYLMRTAAVAGKGNIRYSLALGSSAGATTYLAGSTVTAAGMTASAATIAATSAYPSVTDYISGRSAGDFQTLAGLSLARCALVAGASQTGAALAIDQLPASTVGLLLEGDQVQIGNELLIVAASLDSDSSGAGTLVLHRPPRTAPADNAPVIIHEPMGLFMLAEPDNAWSNIPGRIANATLNLVEAIA